MSAAAFQTALARLVVDPDFGARLAAGDPDALAGDLTELERERLRAVAADPGLAPTRTLHKGFRLGKVLALVPLTCRLLGDDLLAREIRAFWRGRPPTSFYFVDETIDFCDHLLARAGRGLRVRYLTEVVAYERATLEIERPRPEGEEVPAQSVEFRHDPATLIAALSRGEVPARLRRRRCRLVGVRTPAGEASWSVVEAGSGRNLPAAAP